MKKGTKKKRKLPYCIFCGKPMEIVNYLFDSKTGKPTKTAIIVCGDYYKFTSTHSGYQTYII